MTNYLAKLTELVSNRQITQKERLDARLSFWFMLAYFLSWIVYVFFYSWMFENFYAVMGAVAGVVTSGLALLLIVTTRYYRLGIYIANIGALLALITITAVTGGLISYIPFWIIGLAVASYLLTGAYGGRLITIMGCILSFVVFASDYNDLPIYSFPFNTADKTFKIFNLLVWITSLAVTSIVSNIFLTMVQNAYKQAQKARQEVERKSRDVRNIMRNINQGIFTISNIKNRLSVDKDYSLYLEKIFENKLPQKISGIDPLRIFERLSLSKEHLSMIRTTMILSLGEDEIQYHLNDHNLPVEGMLDDSIFEIDFSPMLTNEGVVEKVLVSLKDVTSYRKLQKNQVEKEREVKKLIEIAGINQKDYSILIQSTLSYLDESFTLLGNMETNYLGKLKQIFRNIHTIKGLARNYSLSSVSCLAHESEEKLSQQIKARRLDKQEIEKSLKDVQQEIENIKKLAITKLNRTVSIESINIDLKKLNQWYTEGTFLANTAFKYEYKNRLISMLNDIRKTFSLTIDDMIEAESEAVLRISHQLGKTPPRLTTECEDVFLNHDKSNVFKSCFAHLIRNSLDHGIEPDIIRSESAKVLPGCIHIHTYLNSHELIIEYFDDGAGLDIDALTAKSIELGLTTKEESLGKNDLDDLIFRTGVTTKKKLTDISGRGAGMGAIRDIIESHGGTIHLEYEYTRSGCAPFKTVITLPKVEFCDAS